MIDRMFGSAPDPVPTFKDKILHIITTHYRGLLGIIPPVIFLVAGLTGHLQTNLSKVTFYLWIVIFWMNLLRPVPTAVLYTVPIFFIPMTNLLSSDAICSKMFNTMTALMIIGGYARQLMNCSGCDKRIIHWFLGKAKGTKGILIYGSIATFITSTLSDRLHVTPYIISTVLTSFQAGESNPRLKCIMCNAFATSATIGSLTVMNGSWSTIVMRQLWELSDHGEVFNFFDYSLYAVPVCLVMFIVNLVYHVALVGATNLTPDQMVQTKNSFNESRGKITEPFNHSLIGGLVSIITYLLYFTRWSLTMKRITGKRGWGDGAVTATGDCRIPDVTISVIICLACAMAPLSLSFLRDLTSANPVGKTEMPILVWRFVDKSTNYGYLLLIGGYSALNIVIGKNNVATNYLSDFSAIASMPRLFGVTIVAVISVVLCNIMTSVAAAGMMQMLLLNAMKKDVSNKYLLVLTAGVATSLSFTIRFIHNPIYFCKSVGKVPLSQQVLHGIPSVLICVAVLILLTTFIAPSVFEPSSTTPSTTPSPTTTTTPPP